MEMNVINQPVLSLNASWQAIGTKTVKDAFIAMLGGDGGKNAPAVAIDMEFEIDSDGSVDWNSPTNTNPVTWDIWKFILVT
jgi:hypothetical protein